MCDRLAEGKALDRLLISEFQNLDWEIPLFIEVKSTVLLLEF